jgi:hypothetical protein
MILPHYYCFLFDLFWVHTPQLAVAIMPKQITKNTTQLAAVGIFLLIMIFLDYGFV